MSKRFELVASSKELVITKEKTAIRVELQYGKENEPSELVIAEMYFKDGTWAYTRSQVRIACTTENAKYILESVKAMHDASKKVVKAPKSSKIESAIDMMTDEEKLALLSLLSAKVTPDTSSKTKKPKEDTKTATELVLDATLTNRKRK